MRETKVLLALAYILVLAACFTEPPVVPTPISPALVTEAETQPWSALSEALLN